MKFPPALVSFLSTHKAMLVFSVVAILALLALGPPGCGATDKEVDQARASALERKVDLEASATRAESAASAAVADPQRALLQGRLSALESALATMGESLDEASRATLAASKTVLESQVRDISAGVERLRGVAADARGKAEAEARRIAEIDAKAATDKPHEPGLVEQVVASMADKVVPGAGLALASIVGLLVRGNKKQALVDQYKGKVVTSVKIVDALEEVKLLEPALGELLKKHKDVLARYMGVDGLAFVEAVQKAGNDPLSAAIV